MATIIPFTDITTGALTGTGYYDKLMQTTLLHLKREYEASRINKHDYASAYIELMKNTLSEAIKYSLEIKKTEVGVDKAIADIAQTEANTALTLCKTDQCSKETLGIEANTLLTYKKIEDIDKDMEVKDKTIWLMVKDGAIKDQELLVLIQEVVHSQHKNALIVKQIEKLAVDILKEHKEIEYLEQDILFMKAKIIKMQKDSLLVDKQIELMSQDILKAIQEVLVMKQKVLLMQAEVLRMQNEASKIAAQILLIQAQIDKLDKDGQLIDKEILLMAQKILLMKAQIKKMEADAKIAEELVKKSKEDIKLVKCQVLKCAQELLLLKDEVDFNIIRKLGLSLANDAVSAKIIVDGVRAGLITAQINSEQAKTGNNYHADSVLGAQVKLLKNQAASYKADMIKAVSKGYQDMFSVSRTQNIDGVSYVNALSATGKLDAMLTTANTLFE